MNFPGSNTSDLHQTAPRFNYSILYEQGESNLSKF